jgi:hypothetical protein
MDSTKFVKPKPGMIVRDPKSKIPIPVEGMNVPWVGSEGSFWRRRLTDGSIEIVEPAKPVEIDVVKEPKRIFGKKEETK